jgi:hypothetical protein
MEAFSPKDSLFILTYAYRNYCLDVEVDGTNGREFLKCEYNRDGEAYRSPWSNRYFPEDSVSPDANYPSSELL